MAVQPALCRTWLETLKAGFLVLLLIYHRSFYKVMFCNIFRMKNLDGYVHNLKKRQMLRAHRKLSRNQTPRLAKVCTIISPICWHHIMSHVMTKPVTRVSDLVRHKLGCTSTEDGQRLEFQIEEVVATYYLCSKYKGADQLHDNRAADLCICFCIWKKQFFS